ncbi:ATP-binding protein [Massilia solisilvae]|uniref:ATP-binding protein n=1 Tax=Massilia solisilvae TaxID=1811225 RepID=A0ABT2BR88_9BURK|nr:ATP-binding protein [Massilia solisilvae]MCS0610970.1 ATP-binding protein [Massilia solisilvae]
MVDRKVVDDDRFDDIEVTASGRRIRRQLKSSEHADRALSYTDFNSGNSSLRFDRLVKTFTSEGREHADEYRLSVTWCAPSATDPIAQLLKTASATGTFEGYATGTFRLDPQAVWPREGPPIFAFLQSTQGLAREDVVRFCERFVIEVALPPASLDIDAPGSLEQLLLNVLAEQVGIGRYPNGDRRVEDVAALVIYVASTARTNGDVLTPSDIAQKLGLRTDFGRVAQAFPLDRSTLQERLTLRARLIESIACGGVHLVLAGPGSGKSWTLTQVAEDLELEGKVVARHYCFLEPGDELVERRVTTDVFFGNLLGELSDALKAKSRTSPQVFAAGLNELEDVLEHAAKGDTQVVVIVDGLDHIARVLDASKSLSDSETDIVERLATLNLPEGVTLVVGSQPGPHLDALRDAFRDRIMEHAVDPWSKEELFGLAAKLGVEAALDSVNLLDEERRKNVMNLLAQRSEGNPLYARYLCRGIVDGLLAGTLADPAEWLNAAPAIMGDIARYYRHLYESASAQAQAIADVLGVLDFSVTEAELQEIVGALLEDRVPEALVVLSPVLTRATAQGGLRIFHESFRRFMLQELQRRNIRLSNVLKPVVQWLESQDFFANAKSYRFTLPVMRRAGRDIDILQRVSTSFVRESVLHGHPHDVIERNLALAADVAARLLDWPALLRFAELWRALDSCFDPGTNDWHEYWQTYEAISGPNAVAERLLFDGRPTLSRTMGLLACELVDKAGATAPWQEYLSLPVADDEGRHSSDFDAGGALTSDEETGLAAIRGRLRLGQHLRIVRRVHAHLCHPDAEPTSFFVRKLAELLAEEISPSLVEKMIRRAAFEPPKRYMLAKRNACALLLGLADVARNAEDGAATVRYAVAAMQHANTPEEALWCIEAGAAPSQASDFVTLPDSLDIGVEESGHSLSAPAVRRWVASVRLLARDPNGSAILSEQRRRANGEGWYRCWLRYVLSLAQAEVAAAENRDYDIRAAFTELTADTRPFHGTPRPCDLYSIHRIIDESLARGLTFVRTTEDWEHALNCILEARSGTSSRLDREDGGPITASSFFSILLAHASSPVASDVIIAVLERELEAEEANGTYYGTHAEFRMRMARLHALTRQSARALEHWHKAGYFLLGYGFHKDIALFDVIESVPALLGHAEHTALSALVRLQPLLSAVLRHTDRRETKHAPNAWFGALLDVNRVRSIELLCRDFIRDPGSPSWMAERALKEVLRHEIDTADPLLLDALWATQLFEIEYQNEGGRIAEERLAPLHRLTTAFPEYVRERFVRLCAEASDDTRHYRDGAIAALRSFASKYNLAWQYSEEQDTLNETDGTPVGLEKSPSLQLGQRPAFPQSPRFVDILASLRRLSQERVPREQVDGLVTLPLSYVLTEMVERGEETQAHRLLHFLVHETPFWSFESTHPIEALAQCLDEAGHTRLAAVAHTLTFTSSRGGRGWLNFGDRSQAVVLQRAMELDKQLALQTLAEETARKLRSGGYSGIAKHLVEQISAWGDHEIAVRAWDEAFGVIESRLPLPGSTSLFESLDMNDMIDWSVDEGLATLLLVRIGHPVLPRRIAALSAFARLLNNRAALFRKPVRWLLTRDSTVSTVQSILQILLETPAEVADILEFNEDMLQGYAASGSWSLSVLAGRLLARLGRPVSATRSRFTPVEETASHRGRVLAKYGDVGNVLEMLAHLWSDLPEIVAARMRQPSVDNETFKHYARERAELAFGRRGETVPPAQVLPWPGELLIAVLDETLFGLYEHIWRQGNWSVDVEDEVLSIVLPDLQSHFALDASRVRRPNWPFANEARDQITQMNIMSDEDPTYGGWVRLALCEKNFYHSADRSYEPPNRRAIWAAGVVRAAMDGTVPPRASAHGESDPGPWWYEIEGVEALMDARKPQLVKLASVADWLGKCLALVPPVSLRYRAKLQPPAYGAPLVWYDPSGKAAVVLRSWRVRGDRPDIEWHTTVGEDLLMRPDLLATLFDLYGGPLKELQRSNVSEMNNG